MKHNDVGQNRGAIKKEAEARTAAIASMKCKTGEARGVGAPMTTAGSCSCSAFPWKVAAGTGSAVSGGEKDEEENKQNIFPYTVYVENIAEKK